MRSKRFTSLFLTLFFVVSVFSESDKKVPVVTMVSYEQSWLDYEGTLALRNNLNEDIHDIAFQIVYLDMSNNPLDYADFSKKVEIAPGMTKKINIPAYEHGRHYHYYKTKDEFHNPAFKIKFKLKGYNEKTVANSPVTEPDVKNFANTDEDFVDDNFFTSIVPVGISTALFGWLMLFVVISLCVGGYVIVAFMAQRRDRSVVAWLFLSLFTTPLLCIIILLLIGSNEKDVIIGDRNSRRDRFFDDDDSMNAM